MNIFTNSGASLARNRAEWETFVEGL